jgi:hypothetical protein
MNPGTTVVARRTGALLVFFLCIVGACEAGDDTAPPGPLGQQAQWVSSLPPARASRPAAAVRIHAPVPGANVTVTRPVSPSASP